MNVNMKKLVINIELRGSIPQRFEGMNGKQITDEVIQNLPLQVEELLKDNLNVRVQSTILDLSKNVQDSSIVTLPSRLRFLIWLNSVLLQRLFMLFFICLIIGGFGITFVDTFGGSLPVDSRILFTIASLAGIIPLYKKWHLYLPAKLVHLFMGNKEVYTDEEITKFEDSIYRKLFW